MGQISTKFIEDLAVTDAKRTIVGLVKGGTGQNASGVADGQVLIGKASDSSFTLATLTQGTGITITEGGGTITIATVAAAAWTRTGTDVHLTNIGDNVGVGTASPALPLHIIVSARGGPATSGTAQTGGFRMGSPDNNVVLDCGITTGNKIYIQGTDKVDLSLEYDLLLNPNGGNVGINVIPSGARFQVAESGSNIGAKIQHSGSGTSLNITSSGSGYGIRITNSSGGTALDVTNSAATTAARVTQNTNAATALSIVQNTDSVGININKAGTGAGTALSVTNSGTGNAINVTQSGVGTVMVITQNTDTTGVSIVKTGTLTGTALGIQNDGTGIAVDINQVGNGIGLNVSNNTAPSPTANLVNLVNKGTGHALRITDTGTGQSLSISHSSVSPTAHFISTGALVSGQSFLFQTTNTGHTGPSMQIDSNGTGNLLYLSMGSATTGGGRAILATNAGATSPSSNLVELTNTGIGNALYISQTGSGIGLKVVTSNASAQPVAAFISTAIDPQVYIGDAVSSNNAAILGYHRTDNRAYLVVAGRPNTDFTIDAGGNAGMGTSVFGTAATQTLGIAIGTEPSTSPAGIIQIYAKDSSDGALNATLAFRTEQVVEAIGTFTPSHKHKIWLNGVEYWIQLDAV